MRIIKYSFTIKAHEFQELKTVVVLHNAHFRFVGNPHRTGDGYEFLVKLGFNSLKDYSAFVHSWNDYRYAHVVEVEDRWYTKLLKRIRALFSK